MEYTITYQENPSHDDVQKLGNGIIAYAKLMKNQPPIEFFAFFVRDENNKIKGGCSGSLYYGCLYTDTLWLDEAYRRQGIGTALMLKAEKLAQEKKCLFATVNTMDWEALRFYEKLGYQIEFQRSGYFHHSTLFFLRKDLTSL